MVQYPKLSTWFCSYHTSGDFMGFTFGYPRHLTGLKAAFILLYLKCLRSHLVWAKAVHNKHKALIEIHGYSTARPFSPRCVQFRKLQEIELEATTNYHGQSPRPHFLLNLTAMVIFFPPGDRKPSPDLQNPTKLLEFLLTTPNAA